MLVQQLQEYFIPIANELLPKINEFLRTGAAPVIEKIGTFVGEIVSNFGALWTTIKLIGGFIAARMVGSFVAIAVQSGITLANTRKQQAASAAVAVEEGVIAGAKLAGASASTLGLGIPAILAGIAAGAAALIGIMNIGDGMIDPKGGLVVSGEKGTYKLDKNDYVVAGTDLGKKQNPGGGGGGGSVSIDMTPVVAELQNVKAVLNQILSKEGTVNMDSTKVGTTTNIGTYKVQ